MEALEEWDVHTFTPMRWCEAIAHSMMRGAKQFMWGLLPVASLSAQDASQMRGQSWHRFQNTVGPGDSLEDTGIFNLHLYFRDMKVACCAEFLSAQCCR